MVSWWPHLNLHRHDEADNLQGLLYIDYGLPRAPYDRRHHPGLQFYPDSQEPDEGGVAYRERGSRRTRLHTRGPGTVD